MNRTKILTLPTLCLLLPVIMLLNACGGGTFLGKKNQGIIKFDVTFPYEQNTLLLELFPREMIMDFKGDKTHTSVKSSYGVVSTEFIIDHDKKTIGQLLKSFSDKYVLNLKDDQVGHWLKQYPAVRIEYTRDIETIAGYKCEKAIAVFENDSTPPIELYYTKDLPLDHTNWWNQFNGIDGCLLGYDIEQYGKRMRLRAREVIFEEVTEDKFEVPQGYEEVNTDRMKQEMDKLVTEFMN